MFIQTAPGLKEQLTFTSLKAEQLRYSSANSTIQMSVYMNNMEHSKVIDANVPIAVNFTVQVEMLITNTNYNATVTWPIGTNNVNVALAPS